MTVYIVMPGAVEELWELDADEECAGSSCSLEL